MSRLPARIAAEQRGRRAEWVAAAWLMAKGYRILAHRFRVPQGEVDLIAKRGRLIAFVEVKARATHDEAVWAVTTQTERRIAAAAQIWQARHAQGPKVSFRYDVVAVAGMIPRHFPDAWRPLSGNKRDVNPDIF